MSALKNGYMKKYTIMFWVTTSIIFLMEGVATGLTAHSKMSIDGITALGYPVYFVTMLAVFKVLGAFALIIPQVPSRIKEWAYAGFAIDFISALVSILVVGGFVVTAVLPIIFIGILVVSYVSYHKMRV